MGERMDNLPSCELLAAGNTSCTLLIAPLRSSLNLRRGGIYLYHVGRYLTFPDSGPVELFSQLVSVPVHDSTGF